MAARPQLINGSWRKPLISRRHLAKLRNEHLENGLPWEEPAANYSVAKVRNPDKPLYKGHKRLRPETIAKRYTSTLALCSATQLVAVPIATRRFSSRSFHCAGKR